MKRLFVLILSVLATTACVWDRDTLGMEVKKFPGLTQIITGRFERNPRLYYQMRLDRVAKELESNPTNLELYDDAGVACDRLGRGKEAIAWMTRKKAILDKSPNKEHLYRYHANLGTFLAHEWFRGKNKKDLTLLKNGRKHISKAIEINPDAHFGREAVQLAVMDSVLGKARDHSISSLFFESREPSKTMSDELAKGLSGLIVLGNAWESVDVFAELQLALSGKHASLASLAALRANELFAQGKRSRNADANKHFPLRVRSGEVKKWFGTLRREANEWAEKREAYMMERLKQGRHPDTDSNFWSEWKDEGPPEIPVPLVNWAGLAWPQILLVTAAVLLCIAAIAAYIRSSRPKARA
jgi:hypothetical protein